MPLFEMVGMMRGLILPAADVRKVTLAVWKLTVAVGENGQKPRICAVRAGLTAFSKDPVCV